MSNIFTDFAKVYIDYDEAAPPPHPGTSWTRFVCISDTHSRYFAIPDGDVLLHSGDLSSWGYPAQLHVTLAWLKGLPHSFKAIIAGNHDLCLDPDIPADEQVAPTEGDSSLGATRQYIRSESLIDSRLHYLEHESINFIASSGRTWKIYGSPSTPRYAGGAFQYTTKEAAQAIYDKIPHDIEIILTHTPPYLILDRTTRGKHAGCPCLARSLNSFDQCRLHVFGHIHEAWGAKVLLSGRSSIVFVNAALASRNTRAIIVDLIN